MLWSCYFLRSGFCHMRTKAVNRKYEKKPCKMYLYFALLVSITTVWFLWPKPSSLPVTVPAGSQHKNSIVRDWGYCWAQSTRQCPTSPFPAQQQIKNKTWKSWTADLQNKSILRLPSSKPQFKLEPAVTYVLRETQIGGLNGKKGDNTATLKEKTTPSFFDHYTRQYSAAVKFRSGIA